MRMITSRNSWLRYMTLATASLSLKVIDKAVESALQKVNIGNILSLIQPQTRSLFRSFVTSILSCLFRLVRANRWFTKSALVDFSQPLYLLTNASEGNRKSMESLWAAARFFDPPLIRENVWVSLVSCWSSRFFADAHDHSKELLTISEPTLRDNGDCWVWFTIELINEETTTTSEAIWNTIDFPNLTAKFNKTPFLLKNACNPFSCSGKKLSDAENASFFHWMRPSLPTSWIYLYLSCIVTFLAFLTSKKVQRWGSLIG